MKPTRIRPLSQVYRHLSENLYETLLCLYTSDITPKEDNSSLQKLETSLSKIENHIALEETLLLGILHDYEPFVTAILRDDYNECIRLINCLRLKMMIAENTTKASASHFYCNSLLYQFNGFLNCCLEQMKTHENLINPVLWRYYSDEELTHIETSFAIVKPCITSKRPAFMAE